MTNYEKLKSIFPKTIILEVKNQACKTRALIFSEEWLNMEYPKYYWRPVSYYGYADGNPVYDTWECPCCGYEHNGDSDTLTAYCPDCGKRLRIGGEFL